MHGQRLLLSLLLLGVTSGYAQQGRPTYNVRVEKDFAEPSWLQQGIVVAGNWEGLAFRARKGGQGEDGIPEDLEESFRLEHTPAVVLSLKSAGVNLVILNYYKTGLASDAVDIEATRHFMQLCREQGIRVGLYIGGTIFADTLLHDVPEARQWVSTDDTGAPLRYWDAPYRYLPDFNHPGYVHYLESVLRKAIVELHPDVIHLDNFSLAPPPHTASTPEVTRRFRAFVEAKYTEEQRKDRFGFSDVSGLTVPSWSGIESPETLSPITDPVIEEWIDFRCGDLADYYAKLATYARALDPDVVVEVNPHGIYGANRAYLDGIDHARLLPHGSVFWTEEQNEAQVTAEGILVSKIRSYKLAAHLGQTLFTYTGPSSTNLARHSYLLQLAEAMAFNRDCLGDVGEAKPTTAWPADLRQYIDFFKAENPHFQNRRSVADVALLRSFPSMSFNSKGPQLQTTLLEQLLIQYKIPFDIVFDADLADLSAYRVLVAADQESLADVSLQQIAKYVSGGGGFLTLGQTGQFTEWHRRRSQDRLRKLLTFLPETGGAEQIRNVGKGRVVYTPLVQPAAAYKKQSSAGELPLEADGYQSSYWKLPQNADALVDAIHAAAGSPLTIDFENAPLTTVMQLTSNKAGDELVLHWLNYESGAKVPAAYVTIQLAPGKQIASIEVISPGQQGRPLAFTQSGSSVRMQLPAFSVYEVAVVSLK